MIIKEMTFLNGTYSQKEWGFFSPLTTYALRLTVRKVRVDEISEREKLVGELG